MSRAAKYAEALLGLLSEHVDACDQWDDHYSAVYGGRIKLQEEKDQNERLRANVTRPLIGRCVAEDFEYSDLGEIIPPAFATSKRDRAELLDDLRSWAEDAYDFRANY